MKKFLLVATILFSTCVSAQLREGIVGREAVARFGEDIAQAFNKRDAKTLALLIDLRGVALRAARFQGLNPTDLEQFAAGVESAGMKNIFGGYFRTLDSSQGTVKFMRVTNTTPARALVRLDFGENGSDYHEYVIETREGRTRAVDWFQLSSGELVSVTIGGISQLFTTSDAGLVGKLFGGAKVDEAGLANLRKVGELQRAGKYAEALATIRKLPPQLANSRILLSAQASMASLAKQDDEYSRILTMLAEKYSDDPTASFMLIDHYLLQKDVPNTLKAIDTMEKRVGVDGITSYLRAATYFVVDDFKNALVYADQSVAVEPDRVNGYDIRATVLVRLERFADAVAQYRDIEKKFELAFSRKSFQDDPKFAKFVASAEFRKWLPK